MSDSSLSIVMFPWFGMGHLTAFLHMSNKLAENGHKIFFLLPKNTQVKLQLFNLHPELIKFIPLTVPQLEGLPPGAETTLDIPLSLQPRLAAAMDLTRPAVESFLKETKPLDVIFFDFQHWLPSVSRPLRIKSIQFWTMSPAAVAYIAREDLPTVSDLMKPPPGYPSSSVHLTTHEARGILDFLMARVEDTENDISMLMRLLIAADECDAIGIKTCREMEGPYIEFFEYVCPKPILLAGPVVPEPPTANLEEKWANWLNRFSSRKVIFCAFGSECRLQMDQFQELLLGFELTALPFIVAVKPPLGADTVEGALPEGFKERTQGSGIVYGGWVQQQLILAHPSVGCFVTHCGLGSMSEALVSECQIVLLPNRGDQVINARVMGGVLRVGVEVKKGEDDGLFTKEGVCKAIQLVMQDGSEIGEEVRANHTKWRDFLLRDGIESSYTNDFIEKLRGLVN